MAISALTDAQEKVTARATAVQCGHPRRSPGDHRLRHWHDDGEHYDLEHFQLLPESREWHVRRTSYWALGQDRPAALAAGAGFVDPVWRMPEETGFFQPVLVARAGE